MALLITPSSPFPPPLKSMLVNHVEIEVHRSEGFVRFSVLVSQVLILLSSLLFFAVSRSARMKSFILVTAPGSFVARF